MPFLEESRVKSLVYMLFSYTYVYVCVCVCVHIRELAEEMYACVYIYMCVSVSVYIYIYILTCTRWVDCSVRAVRRIRPGSGLKQAEKNPKVKARLAFSHSLASSSSIGII